LTNHCPTLLELLMPNAGTLFLDFALVYQASATDPSAKASLVRKISALLWMTGSPYLS
jgi:hypothetical protein